MYSDIKVRLIAVTERERQQLLMGTKDAGKYLKGEFILHTKFYPETSWTEIWQCQCTEVFCRDTDLNTHFDSL
jgi:hypothetical protein